MNPAATPPRHADLDDFLARARRRLLPSPPSLDGSGDPLAPPGDHVLAPGVIGLERARLARPAAVLVAIVTHEAAPTLLLTRRSTALKTHSGQVAFPGGRMDPHETSPLRTALREAEEEIELSSARVRPIGYLEPYLTGTGFRVVPVVALVRPGFELVLDPVEVDAVFEVPLAFLMSPENHTPGRREHDGAIHAFYEMPYGDHLIWGVTAGIIRRLWEKVYG